MSESLVKLVFTILATLLVSIILFIMVFGSTGQNMMWRAIEPMMIEQWIGTTMDNGGDRTLIYERQFRELNTIKYNAN